MIRTASITLVAVAFLPIALILILFGINRLNPSRRKGVWLKLAVIANSSLVLILSFWGCCGKAKPGEITVLCYSPPAESDFTEVPKNFEESSDWNTLENWLLQLENHISRSDYDSEFLDRFGEVVWPAINNLRNEGLINEEDSDIITAYCGSRVRYYSQVFGGVSCYAAVPTPEGREATKEEIVQATTELRTLYSEGEIGTPAYETALATLEDQLAVYTGKEDNAVLRQLLLDLADGMGGAYY